MFGGSQVGSGGLLALSNLNGVTGFKLDGELSKSQSGFSVSGAGDFNKDGYADLLIGTRSVDNTFVVFGGAQVGKSGLLALGNLNGETGFKLVDSGGYNVVSTAGDINGDEYDDILIGDVGYSRNFIVFGGPEVGSSGTLVLSNLNGATGFRLDDEAPNDYSGNFVDALGDFNGDGVGDFIIGAYGYGSSKGRSYVVFGDIPPTLVQNCLTLQFGNTVLLNSTFLSAYDRNHNNNTLVFVPSAITHGHFELTSKPGIAAVNFSQPQLLSGSVQFIHDGSSSAPSYNISVYSTGISWTGPVPANITFFGNFVIENNQLIINQGQRVVLTSNNLKATYMNQTSGNLNFLISNISHGQFEFLSIPGKPILIFQQQNITDGPRMFCA